MAKSDDHKRATGETPPPALLIYLNEMMQRVAAHRPPPRTPVSSQTHVHGGRLTHLRMASLAGAALPSTVLLLAFPQSTRLTLSLFAVVSASALLLLMLLEVLSSAGKLVQTQYERAGVYERGVEFFPSIKRAWLLPQLATAVAGQVIGFSGVFAYLSATDGVAFSESLDSRLSSLYFSVTTFATVGFGDIYAKSPDARFAVLCEIVLSFTSVVVSVAILISWMTTESIAAGGRRLQEAADRVQEFEEILRKAKVGLYAEKEEVARLERLMREQEHD